jgi:hypothetical protein
MAEIPGVTDLEKYRKRHKALLLNRSYWEPIWKDLCSYVLPQYGKALYPGFEGRPRLGNENMVTSWPTMAARVTAAGLQSGMTSKARQWWRASLPDTDMAKYPRFREWLDEITFRMTYVMGQSNFYEGTYGVWGQAPTYGTGVTVFLEDFNDVIRAHTLTIGEYALASDFTMRNNTLYRTFWLRGWELVDRFGKKNVSRNVRDAYDRNDTEQWYKVIHIIEPNDDRIKMSGSNKNMPYRSVYYEDAATEDDGVLEVKGFEEKPFATFRWEVAGRDDYGFGPGWVVLPDCKELHATIRDRGVGIEKSVNPPLQAHIQDMDRMVNAAPGGLSFYSNLQSGNAGKISPLYEVAPDLNGIQLSITELRELVDQAYYKDLFLALMARSGGSAEKTAREVVEIQQEKLLMLSPALERADEYLNDAINRIFGIMMRGGLLPPPPPDLQGQEITIEYVSILAQAQQMIESSKIEQGAAFIAQLAGMYPEVADILDPDMVGEAYLSAIQIPQKYLRDRKVRDAIRAERMRLQKQAEEAQQMQQIVEQGKTLSEADMSGQNALSALLMGASGGLQ